MDFSSLASVALWAIVAVLLCGYLPYRTVRGMKHAAEHREDRYSASLHIIDMNDGMHFGDVDDHAGHIGTKESITGTTSGKGAVMQPTAAEASTKEERHIAKVRRMRRAAIRRRRVLVLSLLAVAVLVLVLALALHFSPLFALIPVALDAVVLGCGVHATKQAMAWEAKVAARKQATQGRGVKHQGNATSQTADRNDRMEKTLVVESVEAAESATDAMSQEEIQAVIERSKAEKQRTLERHRQQQRAEHPKQVNAAEAKSQRQMSDTAESSETVAASEDAEPKSFRPRRERHRLHQPSQTDMKPSETSQSVSGETAQPSKDLVVHSQPTLLEQAMGDDTTELQQVAASHALDAFELASSQDLISFSLGEPRQGVEYRREEPQSLEIKSTKQVAHAEPVAQQSEASDEVVAPQSATQEDAQPDSPVAADDAMSQLVDAKKAAQQTEQKVERSRAAAAKLPVEAPDRSSDSLGADVDAVLARRRG